MLCYITGFVFMEGFPAVLGGFPSISGFQLSISEFFPAILGFLPLIWCFAPPPLLGFPLHFGDSPQFQAPHNFGGPHHPFLACHPNIKVLSPNVGVLTTCLRFLPLIWGLAPRDLGL